MLGRSGCMPAVGRPRSVARSGMALLPVRAGRGRVVPQRPAARGGMIMTSRGRCSAVAVRAALTARGESFPASSISVKRVLGEGAYGQVFLGTLMTDPKNNLSMEEVVLKRCNPRSQKAESGAMASAEVVLNVYVAKAAKGRACAEFVGYCNVQRAVGRLTPGLWLVRPAVVVVGACGQDLLVWFAPPCCCVGAGRARGAPALQSAALQQPVQHCRATHLPLPTSTFLLHETARNLKPFCTPAADE